MTDQNEREWPSFGDILEELNSLGGLTRSTTPVESGADVAQPTESIDTAELPEMPLPLLPSLPEESFGVTYDPDAAEVEDESEPPVAVSDAIDWSSWDAQAEPTTSEDPFAQTFDPSGSFTDFSESPQPSDLSDLTPLDDPAEAGLEPSDDAVIFEFDPSALEPAPDAETEPEAFAPAPGTIDSVATANAIETDLQELFSFVQDEDDEDEAVDHRDQSLAELDLAEPAADEGPVDDDPDEAVDSDPDEAVDSDPDEAVDSDPDEAVDSDPDVAEADNVVPLHQPNDNSEHVMGLDDLFDPAKPQPVTESSPAEFVSMGVEPTTADDSWEYLRPDEEDVVKDGIWSRRPKLFGGDERKTRKAERKKAQEENELQGPPCPKCGAAGHVDLDDPIGGKIHCSCRSCDHVWSQFAESTQESA